MKFDGHTALRTNLVAHLLLMKYCFIL